VITPRGTLTVNGCPFAENCTVWFSTTIVVGLAPSLLGLITLVNQMQLPPAMAVLLNFDGIEIAGHGMSVAVGI
jgi:hypothetical protein